jgi:hypothetical protein
MALLGAPSPTPKNVADAYRSLVSDRAGKASGKDRRLTANEASKDPFVADAYARAGKQKPSISSIAEAARSAMLSEATSAASGDGRVSKSDAKGMSPLFAQAFEALRGKASSSPAEVAARFGKLTSGMTFMSESDDPYEPFVVSLAKDSPLSAATLKQALDWGLEPDSDPLPADFQLSLSTDETFWEPYEDASPEEVTRAKAIEKAMKGALSESSGTSSEGEAQSGKIWTVTVREQDSSRAPYYIFGRLESGDLVGLKTWRTWT